MTAVARLHPTETTTLAPITVALIPASSAAAAILRLAAAHGLTVEVEAVVTGEPIRLDLTATLNGGDHPVRLSQDDTRALIGALGAMRAGGLTFLSPGAARTEAGVGAVVAAIREAVAADEAASSGPASAQVANDVEIHPADHTGDPWFRPEPPEAVDIEAPASAPLAAQIETPSPLAAQIKPRTQAVIVDDLPRLEPRFADVCRYLLSPLATMGWPIDSSDTDVSLQALAAEFATYPPRLLREAARRLCAGRHRNFPDAAEIFEALGRAAKPGAAKEDIAS